MNHHRLMIIAQIMTLHRLLKNSFNKKRTPRTLFRIVFRIARLDVSIEYSVYRHFAKRFLIKNAGEAALQSFAFKAIRQAPLEGPFKASELFKPFLSPKLNLKAISKMLS